MEKIDELTPVFMEFLDIPIEEGKLYISKEYGSSKHLCPCGCKEVIVVPFKINWKDDKHWMYIENDGKVSLSPSIGNNYLSCKSHYYITENKINWC